MRKPAKRRGLLARLLQGATLFVCLALPGLCVAQAGASGDRERQAGVHFERGVELYSEGNLDAALVAFERAYELVPTYRVLYNLGQIQAERNEYVAALELFEKYLDEGGDEIPAARRTETLDEISKLRERVAELWVGSDVDGARLFVNDKFIGTLPLSDHILVDPGVCHIRLENAGHRTATRALKVTSGDQLRVEVLLGEPLSTPEAQRVPTSSYERADKTPNYKPFWISSAVAVAMGGTALTFAMLARAADRDLDEELNRFPLREAEVAAQRSELKTYAGLTDGFTAAAAVSAAVALYFLVAPPKSPARAKELSDGKSLRMLPGPGSVALYGRF